VDTRRAKKNTRSHTVSMSRTFFKRNAVDIMLAGFVAGRLLNMRVKPLFYSLSRISIIFSPGFIPVLPIMSIVASCSVSSSASSDRFLLSRYWATSMGKTHFTRLIFFRLIPV